MKTLPGAKGGLAGGHDERNGEEGYRGTDVVCGKSVHIIRRNRKEEISVGTGARGGEGEVNEGWGRARERERYYLRDATRTRMRRRVSRKRAEGRRGEDSKANMRFGNLD